MSFNQDPFREYKLWQLYATIILSGTAGYMVMKLVKQIFHII